MSRLLLLLGVGGCADDVWNYRQMGCGDGENLDLRDGEDRPLVVRSTCADVVDAGSCELKLSGLRGGYHARDGMQLRAHEIEEVEVEGPFHSAGFLWGEASTGADIALYSGPYKLELLDGPTNLDPDAVAPGYAQAFFSPGTADAEGPHLEVFCEGCRVRAVAPPAVGMQLGAGSQALVCIDDPTAFVSLEVTGDATVTLLFPDGFQRVQMSAPNGHTGEVTIRTPLGFVEGTRVHNDGVNRNPTAVPVLSCDPIFDLVDLECARPD